jgi:hypothetical protein
MTGKHGDAFISSGIHVCRQSNRTLSCLRLFQNSRRGNRAQEMSRQEQQRVGLLCLPRSILFGTTAEEWEMFKDGRGHLHPSG